MSNKEERINANILNCTSYDIAYNDMNMIVMSLYKWNVPDSIDVRVLEQSLYDTGLVVFLYDEVLGLLALPATMTNFDIYGNPHSVTVTLPNGYSRTLNDKYDKFVIMYNNLQRLASQPFVAFYATIESNIMTSILNNIKQQQFPYIVSCTTEQRLSLENIVNNLKIKTPFIFLDADFNLFDGIKVFNTTVPHIVPSLYIDKHNNRNDFLTFFGVYNSNTDKRERLITAEANGNIGAIEMSRNSFFDSRKNGCELVNKMFNTNISVEFNSDLNLFVDNYINDYRPIKYEYYSNKEKENEV